jgi:hypothetical protein
MVGGDVTANAIDARDSVVIADVILQTEVCASMARKLSTDSFAVTGSPQEIQGWTTTAHEQLYDLAGSFDATLGRFAPHIGGIYFCWASVNFVLPPSAQDTSLRMAKNGAASTPTGGWLQRTGATNGTVHTSHTWYLEPASYVSLFVLNDAALSVHANFSSFGCYLVERIEL